MGPPESSHVTASRAPPVSDEERALKPWRYLGYPAFSRWMNSSEDFFLLRSFGSLNVRVLLMMQDEIVQVEETLRALDNAIRERPDAEAHSGSFRNDPSKERIDCLKSLKGLLKEYNEYVISYSQIKARPPASAQQINKVKGWLKDHDEAIEAKEQAFITKGRDLIAVRRVPKSPLHAMLATSWRIFKRSRRRKPREGGENQEEEEDFPETAASSTRSSQNWIGAISSTLIIGAGLTLLLVPMWTLPFIDRQVYKLTLITFSLLLFTVSMAVATVVRPFEVLAATAAYAAVLMVFLQASIVLEVDE